MKSMEQDKLILSVTPNNLDIVMYNRMPDEDITETEFYKKCIVDTSVKKYAFGFNYKKPLTESRSSFEDLNFYKNLPLLDFKGFIKRESLELLLNPIFHFPDFDVQILKKDLQLKVSLRNSNDTFNAEEIIKILKYNQLLNDDVNIHQHTFDELNNNNQNNYLITLSSCNKMIGCPFIITPLFPQEHQAYYNGHLTPKYVQVKYFKHYCERFNRFVTFLPISLNENLYVKSFYCLLANERCLEKIFFVELMDETLTNDTFGGQRHAYDAIACQNHHLKIYKSFLDNKNEEIFEEIDTIYLPVLAEISNLNSRPSQDEIPFSNARFDIVTIFRGNLVLYDKKLNVYSCFSLSHSK
jgi:hypothetical protein